MVTQNEILAVLQGRIRVVERSNGDNYACYCPFHKGGQESKPSFYIYVGPPTAGKLPGMSFCHTCNTGWSLRTLLIKLGSRGRDVDEIIAQLPQTAYERKNPLAYTRTISFDNPRLPEEILGAFHWCPVALTRNGFKATVLSEYEIGFDWKAQRITFPLRDHLGNLIGISGRAVHTGQFPRYKFYTRDSFIEYGLKGTYNNPDKSRTLWNIHRPYLVALHSQLPYIIVVEGFKQALWLIQNGYNNTVALMGSHMSREQATLLLRTGAPLRIFLDNDIPGQEATKKITKLLRKQTPEVLAVPYPATAEGLSPDDLSVTELNALLEEVV